ncbi:hypothetical protein A1Q2_05717 [Trichosporon asahii var. asahii CBS 8904]|uniref:Uncharacterized protein n=1 Tax=Trichosporon asahii var. asahii (strain CBS 8904) TaxID=1220162 RepID=K1VTH7_TRIAC|nr:hypothetical protein A1Q2_05717 [Trichosporon asahii var. asahii CBS 8904]
MGRRNKEYRFTKLHSTVPWSEQLRVVTHRSNKTVDELKIKYGDSRDNMELIERSKHVAVVFPFKCFCPGDQCPHARKDHDGYCPLFLRPSFWVFKRSQFLNQHKQDKLWNAYHDLVSEFPNILTPRKAKTDTARLESDSAHNFPVPEPTNRSQSHRPLHLGYWRRSSSEIFLTADTLQNGNYQRQVAVLRFLAILDQVLFGLVWKARQVDPLAIHIGACIAERAVIPNHKSLHPTAIDDAIRLAGGGHPLRLGLMGTTVAVADGFAELYHIDRKDYNHGGCYSFSFSVSPEDKVCKVELHCPTLGYRFPYDAGQLFGLQAGDLLHRVVPREGEKANRAHRLNFTVFMDASTAEDTQSRILKTRIPYVDVPPLKT